VITEPKDGTSVREAVVIVRGLAMPGVTVTRDIPLWFDEHTTADGAGQWSFAVRLEAGKNTLVFRIGDDEATARTLQLRYRSR
jgi:hypothetical protein